MTHFHITDYQVIGCYLKKSISKYIQVYINVHITQAHGNNCFSMQQTTFLCNSFNLAKFFMHKTWFILVVVVIVLLGYSSTSSHLQDLTADSQYQATSQFRQKSSFETKRSVQAGGSSLMHFPLPAQGQHVSPRVTKTNTPLQCPVIISSCTQTCTRSPLEKRKRGQSHNKRLTVCFVEHQALSYIGRACTVD